MIVGNLFVLFVLVPNAQCTQAKDRRMDPTTTNVEACDCHVPVLLICAPQPAQALPPLSRHKLWKSNAQCAVTYRQLQIVTRRSPFTLVLYRLQHGKRLRKPTDVLGERRRLTPGERKRRKKRGTWWFYR